jgi:citrate lyase subunit beta / citryl-CoA lyase
MRRSLLFIPANKPAMLQNADIFNADAVIFDLEDSVLTSDKDAANHLLVEFLKVFKLENIEKIVRINGLDTIFGKNDLSMVVSDEIDTIMLPKATTNSLKELDLLLTQIEKKKKLNKKINVIAIIESAKSLVEINEIAKANRVNGLLLGAEDLTLDLEVIRSDDGLEILIPRSLVIIAAKANQIDAIDTPYTNTKFETGLIKDSHLAKSLGMNAKAAIHPLQVELINQIFSPTKKEIEDAKKILDLELDAIKENKGAFSIDGKMIDKPIILRATKTIEKAKKWNLL